MKSKFVDLIDVVCRRCQTILGRIPFRNWQLYMDGCPRQCPRCGRDLAPQLNAELVDAKEAAK